MTRGDIDTADIARRYRAGASIRAIADELGCCVRTVWLRLSAAGVPRRRPGRDGVDLAEMRGSYLGGEPVASIAARLGISPSGAYRRLKRAGVPMRRPGPPRRREVRPGPLLEAALTVRGILDRARPD